MSHGEHSLLRRELLQTPQALKGGIDRLKFMHPYFNVTSCEYPPEQKNYPLGKRTLDGSILLNGAKEGNNVICTWNKADKRVYVTAAGNGISAEEVLFDGNSGSVEFPYHNLRVTLDDCTIHSAKKGSCEVSSIQTLPETQGPKANNTAIPSGKCVDLNSGKDKWENFITQPKGAYQNVRNEDGTLNAGIWQCKGSAAYSDPDSEIKTTIDLWQAQNQLMIRTFNNGYRRDQIIVGTPLTDEPVEVGQISNIGVTVNGCATTSDGCTIDHVGKSEIITYNPNFQKVEYCASQEGSSLAKPVQTTKSDINTARCLGSLYYNGNTPEQTDRLEFYAFRQTTKDPYQGEVLIFSPSESTAGADEEAIFPIPGDYKHEEYDIHIDEGFNMTVDELPPYPSNAYSIASARELRGIDIPKAWEDIGNLFGPCATMAGVIATFSLLASLSKKFSKKPSGKK